MNDFPTSTTPSPSDDEPASRLTLRAIARDLAERFFSLDRGWLRTAQELFTRPGAMIRCYVRGERKAYANPFAYLLVGTAASVVMQKMIGFGDWAMESSLVDQTISPRQLALSQQAQDLAQQYMLWVSLGILIPFALLLRLFFRRVGYNLAETTVFALYTGGHLALIGVVSLPVTKLLGVNPLFVGFPLAFAYFGYAAIGFFGGRIATVVKTCCAYLVGFLIYLLIAIIMAIVIFIAFFLSAFTAKEDWNLVTATEQGQTKVVKQLIAAGDDVDLTLKRTALHVAAENGHREIVELMVRNRANIDATDHLGRSPIFYAMRTGHRDIVWRLLEAGADTTLCAKDGTTLLIMCARDKETDLARRLLETGCDVNAVRSDDRTVTALMRAARSGNLAMVELLLEHGADPSITNPDGKTALDLARNRAVKDLLHAALDSQPVPLPSQDNPARPR